MGCSVVWKQAEPPPPNLLEERETLTALSLGTSLSIGIGCPLWLSASQARATQLPSVNSSLGNQSRGFGGWGEDGESDGAGRRSHPALSCFSPSFLFFSNSPPNPSLAPFFPVTTPEKFSPPSRPLHAPLFAPHSPTAAGWCSCLREEIRFRSGEGAWVSIELPDGAGPWTALCGAEPELRILQRSPAWMTLLVPCHHPEGPARWP